MPSEISRLEAALHAGAQGLSLGFADELAGLLKPEWGQQMKSGYAAAQDAYPVQTMGLEALSGMLLPGGAARSIGKAALTGAGYGGVGALGAAEGSAMERLPSALAGVAAGAGLGAAMPAGIKAMRAKGKSLDNIKVKPRPSHLASHKTYVPPGEVYVRTRPDGVKAYDVYDAGAGHAYLDLDDARRHAAEVLARQGAAKGVAAGPTKQEKTWSSFWRQPASEWAKSAVREPRPGITYGDIAKATNAAHKEGFDYRRAQALRSGDTKELSELALLPSVPKMPGGK